MDINAFLKLLHFHTPLPKSDTNNINNFHFIYPYY